MGVKAYIRIGKINGILIDTIDRRTTNGKKHSKINGYGFIGGLFYGFLFFPKEYIHEEGRLKNFTPMPLKDYLKIVSPNFGDISIPAKDSTINITASIFRKKNTNFHF